ncbi:hypothetical protein [Dolichospermum circinale]|nr:hypothetical protein [Dolichospermum circinale]MDB9450427.1 hypothetical protein [Dolichospermum circinale CS-547]
MDNFSFLTNVFPSVDIFIGFKPALKIDKSKFPSGEEFEVETE